ncbi:tetratricopeptide repeat protein [Undibacterium sp. RuTC16W]|uniref:tetratricopeptide repeat protein n=1 Tax=Undibacterium sp. RuTC16W TaxID=3413048 RepID=UPI003BF35DEB
MMRFCFLLMIVAICCLPAQATPYLPKDDQQVLEHLPLRNDTTQREFRRLRQILIAQPDNLRAATELAQHYIDAARNDGDPRYLGYAQAALKPWWSLIQAPVPVLVLRATLRQSTHQFPAALDDLNAVLKQDRDNAQAWLTRATILQVQGRFAEAKASCMHLYPLAPELVTLTCISNIGSLNGDAAASYTTLHKIYDKNRDADPGIRIWVLTLLAEISARRGDATAAENRYRDAMSLAIPDSYLLGSYADFLLDQHRPADVIALLKNKTKVDALLLRYALALQVQHSPAADQISLLDQRFEAAMLRGDTVHQREQARFELQLKNRPEVALKLAQLNWAIQKEPADLRIYLEAAAASKNLEAAAPAIAWLRQNRLEDIALAPLLNKLGVKQ